MTKFLAPKPTTLKRDTPSQIPVSTLPTFVTNAAREDLGRVPSARKPKDSWVQHERKKQGSTAMAPGHTRRKNEKGKKLGLHSR